MVSFTAACAGRLVKLSLRQRADCRWSNAADRWDQKARGVGLDFELAAHESITVIDFAEVIP